MKKSLALLLALAVLSTVLVGCGSGEITQQDTANKMAQMKKTADAKPHTGGIEQ